MDGIHYEYFDASGRWVDAVSQPGKKMLHPMIRQSGQPYCPANGDLQEAGFGWFESRPETGRDRRVHMVTRTEHTRQPVFVKLIVLTARVDAAMRSAIVEPDVIDQRLDWVNAAHIGRKMRITE